MSTRRQVLSQGLLFSAWPSLAKAEQGGARLKSFSGIAAVARARSALGLRTRYVMDGPLPPRDGWRPGQERTDCSGLVLWAFGLKRANNRLSDSDTSTNDIYADATGAQKVFRRIIGPKPGAIVVYPSYRISDAIGDAGHIGLIVNVEVTDPVVGEWAGAMKENERFSVIDCSGSAFRIFGDAVRENDYLKFLLHDQLMSEARLHTLSLGSRARSPVFAEIVAGTADT